MFRINFATNAPRIQFKFIIFLVAIHDIILIQVDNEICFADNHHASDFS